MADAEGFSLDVNGAAINVADDGATLLDVLREHVGLTSPKDGCSPQGQCGCCTVLVDGAARVACVTPARRVRGRTITTVEGMDEMTQQRWADAFTATGASQCGFCTPGIIVRLVGLAERGSDGDQPDRDDIERSLQAHQCRCTGWQTVVEAALAAQSDPVSPSDRDFEAAARRAELEGGRPQRVGPAVALGHGGFAADAAPVDALVAVPDGDGGWAVGDSLREARQAAGKIQGRRTTIDPAPPLETPAGSWVRELRTGWVEPGYLETDASWCEPGGEPADALGNGGAFGGKESSVAAEAARMLAAEHDRPVRVLLSREDAVLLGPKRPPMAAGIDADGHIAIRVARTEGIRDRLLSGLVANGVDAGHVEIVEVDLPGPPTDIALRSAGIAEGSVLAVARAAIVGGSDPHIARVRAPGGGLAEVEVSSSGVAIRVEAGSVLDAVVLRSYCIGAAHMGLGWATSEGIAVDGDGVVHDLTIRSFGLVRACDTPSMTFTVGDDTGGPVAVSDAVFAAAAAAAWGSQGYPASWPSGQLVPR